MGTTGDLAVKLTSFQSFYGFFQVFSRNEVVSGLLHRRKRFGRRRAAGQGTAGVHVTVLDEAGGSEW